MPTAIVDTQTGLFVQSGATPDARYQVKDVPRNPDAATEKWDGSAIVAKTAQDIADAALAELVATSTGTSRRRDVLTTIAFIIRRANPTAWNNQTLAQKKTAVFAEADTWRDMRVWAEQNL